MRELLAVDPRPIDLTPCGEPGRYQIRAGSHVGVVVTTGTEIRISPKIPLENVFLLLAPSLVPLHMHDQLPGFGENDDFTTAFAALYARVVELTLLRGMRSDYQPVEEPLTALRGRIDMAQQQRSPLLTPLHCRHDEYSLDTPHNRMVKAAALRLVALPGIGEGARGALTQLLPPLR
ncbi:MAG: hypothetical protein M5U31_00295 [Acidimicrobiia bacterium]|nr:hypothetical protein [Acidimicrobiia bacterium]